MWEGSEPGQTQWAMDQGPSRRCWRNSAFNTPSHSVLSQDISEVIVTHLYINGCCTSKHSKHTNFDIKMVLKNDRKCMTKEELIMVLIKTINEAWLPLLCQWSSWQICQSLFIGLQTAGIRVQLCLLQSSAILFNQQQKLFIFVPLRAHTRPWTNTFLYWLPIQDFHYNRYT